MPSTTVARGSTLPILWLAVASGPLLLALCVRKRIIWVEEKTVSVAERNVCNGEIKNIGFHHFPSLPGEIRDHIWEIFDNCPVHKYPLRLIKVEFIRKYRGDFSRGNTLITTQPPPSWLQRRLSLNQQTRRATLQDYTPIFDHRRHNVPIWFNKQVDTLVVHENHLRFFQFCLGWNEAITKYNPLPRTWEVTHLAIQFPEAGESKQTTAAEFYAFLYGAVTFFCTLKEITLLDATSDEERGLREAFGDSFIVSNDFGKVQFVKRSKAELLQIRGEGKQ